MNSFTRTIHSSHPDEVISTIRDLCSRMEVTAYLYRSMSTGSVFLFVSFDGLELTVMTFGYEEYLQGKSTQIHFITVTALEVAEQLRITDSLRGMFSSIDFIAAIPANDVKKVPLSLMVTMIPYNFNFEFSEAEKMTSFLVSIFKAIPIKQAISPFSNV